MFTNRYLRDLLTFEAVAKVNMKRTIKWNIAQKAELKWWQQYLKGKDVEAYHTWKRAYWQGILDKIAGSAPIREGMSILDAGCGPAGMFMQLPNCNVDALDPLLDKYEKRKKSVLQSHYQQIGGVQF